MNEQVLGFRKFGDFLRAAHSAGYVQLRATSGGDIGVWPIGVPLPDMPPGSAPPLSPVVSPSTSNASQGVRIRQDLWNAFNSFSAKWVYDPAKDLAFKEADAAEMWGAQAIAQRPNVIQIPAGRERVIEWMRSFASMQDPETRRRISTVLDGDGPLYQFNNLVRSMNLVRSWSHFHIQQVVAAIDAWAASNSVQPKNVTTPMYWSIHPTVSEQPVSTIPVTPQTIRTQAPAISDAGRTVPQLAASPLTNRLELLVDDLIDELIRLRGLLRVVESKQS